MSLREFNKKELIDIFYSRLESCKDSETYSAELKNYIDVCLNRLIFTTDLIKRYYKVKNGKILEIGSFPFFLTAALLELSDDGITGIIAPDSIWPGEPYEITEDSATIKTEYKEHPFTYWTLNVEKDKFPFEDKSFDMVLCTEVIEHLVQSPANMIYEINRVLKDNGILILSTPNGLFWKYVYNLLFLGSAEPYAKYGVYGRHNRLWVLSELHDILTGNNFKILDSIYTYSHPKAIKIDFATKTKFTIVNLIQDIFLIIFRLLVKLPIPFFKKKEKDQLYVIAEKIGAAKFYYPDYLYAGHFSYNLEKDESH